MQKPEHWHEELVDLKIISRKFKIPGMEWFDRVPTSAFQLSAWKMDRGSQKMMANVLCDCVF